jgi:hypothetical protein
MNNNKRACELCHSALTEGLEKIEDIDEEMFYDAKKLLNSSKRIFHSGKRKRGKIT